MMKSHYLRQIITLILWAVVIPLSSNALAVDYGSKNLIYNNDIYKDDIVNDTFTAAFPKVVFDNWLSRSEAKALNDDTYRRPTLIGYSVIRTYTTNRGERQIELFLTNNNEIYDVGEYLDLGSLADSYISAAAQTIAGRIIWASLTRDEAYLRSVVASSHIRVTTPFLGTKESQILEFIRSNPDLNPGNFYLTIDEFQPILASDARNTPLRISITPTLDLLFQGQSILYRDYLVQMLKSGAADTLSGAFEVSPFYNFSQSGNTFKYELPNIDYYRNARSFSRRSMSDMWVPGSRDQLAIPEGRIASLVAHRWATLALPVAFRYTDLHTADDFSINFAVEGQQVERFSLTGNKPLDWIGTLLGGGLPAYYSTISAQRDNEDVVVRGIWMVRDPELAYEHIFRITDTFVVENSQQYVWKRSEIRAVLGVRTDHIDQLKAKPTTPSGQQPIFKVQMNR